MFPASINLADLDGNNGFVINGVDAGDRSGSSVSNAGDVNGDGIDDLIIGAPSAKDEAGVSYLVFGDNNLGANGSFELSNLNGNNGFLLQGINSNNPNQIYNQGDYSGSSVNNAGDINGDGIDDLIIGAPFADNPNASYGPYNAGETYVVFGGNNLSSSVELSDLNGSNGFVLQGIRGNYSERTFLSSADISGFSVSNSGDINGDGLDDLIIGAPGLSSSQGESYVIFGDNNVGSTGNLELSALNGNNGFIIDTTGQYDIASTGISVSNLGDINGDGFDDVIIGSAVYEPFAGPGYFIGGRESYVIFGDNNVGSSGRVGLSELNGSNGFVLNGVEQSTRLVSNAGDINGDDIDDLIIGVPEDRNNRDTSGKTYIVFGNNNIGNSGDFELSQLNGNNGFVINGIDPQDGFGGSVSNAGDINKDGFDDLIIGAPLVDANGNNNAGSGYVVLGETNIGSNGSLELSSLNGNNGFVLNGVNETDFAGGSVSNAGDVNGDGIDDIIIGAGNAQLNGNYDVGASYVVFGVDNSQPNKITGTPGNDVIDGTVNADQIHALAGDDNVRGLAGNDIINGDAGQDSLFGNNGNDVIDGGDGNDTVWGQADNDSVVGGAGRDRVLGNNGNDTLLGGNGVDTLFGGNGNDSVFGNAENDQVNGNAGNDTLFGGLGSDIIFAGTGDDELFGGEGNDVLWGQANNDFLAGGTGTDVLYGNNGNDVLVGGDGTDSLFGNVGNDSLEGNTGNDILFGNNGSDTLFGGQGNDTLWSGSGNDFLELTRGANVGVDRVKDYVDGVDKFLLSDRFGLGSLEFSDLTIAQNGNNAVISITDNNQVLAIVENVNADQLNGDDFVTE
ncbi:putative calcium-binding protein,FG-GAP repeat protein [Xenococcus sp. PCC 7305]|uniref:FG-GAP repeat protein n=1 Tax=Xenococcus sp. PCC 7305 TaxID=102125 RepID=UPI0002ABCD5A|nr:FG-GAP repeat protein [Xenococcus sp. PCC 7305]ELS03057.1 putative calcium-binding protein,FG-GAP repeat protein [Xenococcus sp. PCC 7305]